MGCTCECHDKLLKIGINGCCWKCEADHDSLRNALLQNDELKKFIESVKCDHGCELAPFEMSYHLPGCVVTRRKALFTEKRKCVHGIEVGDGPCGLCN